MTNAPAHLQSSLTSNGVPDKVLDIWRRIASGLHVKNIKSTREFWLGFCVALNDYHIISEEDYRWLRDNILSYPR